MTDIENKIREAKRACICLHLGVDHPSIAEDVGKKVNAAIDGLLASHQEAAAQITEKDAEIKRVQSTLADWVEMHVNQKSQLTAAREREEKAVVLLKAQASCHRAPVIIEVTEFLAAYDASRAEKKEVS